MASRLRVASSASSVAARCAYGTAAPGRRQHARCGAYCASGSVRALASALASAASAAVAAAVVAEVAAGGDGSVAANEFA